MNVRVYKIVRTQIYACIYMELYQYQEIINF